MNTVQILMMLTILIYLAAMIWIGAILSGKNRTTDDFYLGGRKLGPFVTAMSAEASDRNGRCGVDRHWSGHRNLCELAGSSAETSTLYTCV